MIFVQLFINGSRERINQTRNAIATNMKYLHSNVAAAFQVQKSTVVMTPVFVSGKDLSLSKNMPDVLIHCQAIDGERLPHADQLRDHLLETCVDFDTLQLTVCIAGRPDMYGSSSHRPST